MRKYSTMSTKLFVVVCLMTLSAVSSTSQNCDQTAMLSCYLDRGFSLTDASVGSTVAMLDTVCNNTDNYMAAVQCTYDFITVCSPTVIRLLPNLDKLRGAIQSICQRDFTTEIACYLEHSGDISSCAVAIQSYVDTRDALSTQCSSMHLGEMCARTTLTDCKTQLVELLANLLEASLPEACSAVGDSCTDVNTEIIGCYRSRGFSVREERISREVEPFPPLTSDACFLTSKLHEAVTCALNKVQTCQPHWTSVQPMIDEYVEKVTSMCETNCDFEQYRMDRCFSDQGFNVTEVNQGLFDLPVPDFICNNLQPAGDAIRCIQTRTVGCPMSKIIPGAEAFTQTMEFVCQNAASVNMECVQAATGTIALCISTAMKNITLPSSQVLIQCISVEIRKQCSQMYLSNCGAETVEIVSRHVDMQKPQMCSDDACPIVDAMRCVDGLDLGFGGIMEGDVSISSILSMLQTICPKIDSYEKASQCMADKLKTCENIELPTLPDFSGWREMCENKNNVTDVNCFDNFESKIQACVTNSSLALIGLGQGEMICKVYNISLACSRSALASCGPAIVDSMVTAMNKMTPKGCRGAEDRCRDVEKSVEKCLSTRSFTLTDGVIRAHSEVDCDHYHEAVTCAVQAIQRCPHNAALSTDVLQSLDSHCQGGEVDAECFDAAMEKGMDCFAEHKHKLSDDKDECQVADLLFDCGAKEVGACGEKTWDLVKTLFKGNSGQGCEDPERPGRSPYVKAGPLGGAASPSVGGTTVFTAAVIALWLVHT